MGLFYKRSFFSSIMAKETIVDKVKICENIGHSGNLIKNFGFGNGKYRCNSCGTFYNDHLTQKEKNSFGLDKDIYRR